MELVTHSMVKKILEQNLNKASPKEDTPPSKTTQEPKPSTNFEDDVKQFIKSLNRVANTVAITTGQMDEMSKLLNTPQINVTTNKFPTSVNVSKLYRTEFRSVI